MQHILDWIFFFLLFCLSNINLADFKNWQVLRKLFGEDSEGSNGMINLVTS